MSSYDPIRPSQYLVRNRQVDLLGGFKIYDEFELRRLLDGQIGRLGAFENFIDVRGGAPEQVVIVRAVVGESAGIDKFGSGVGGRKPMLYCQFDDLFSMSVEDGIPEHEKCVRTSFGRGAENGINILGIEHVQERR